MPLVAIRRWTNLLKLRLDKTDSLRVPYCMVNESDACPESMALSVICPTSHVFDEFIVFVIMAWWRVMVSVDSTCGLLPYLEDSAVSILVSGIYYTPMYHSHHRRIASMKFIIVRRSVAVLLVDSLFLYALSDTRKFPLSLIFYTVLLGNVCSAHLI